MSTIGERIKALRETLGLSQMDFGSKVHMSNGHISNVERGTGNLSKRSINAICTEFNANEDWLTTGNGPMFAFLDIAKDKLKEGFEDRKTRYAHAAVQVAGLHSRMLQKIADNLFAAYPEISDCPLVAEDEHHLANEMVTYMFYAWENSSEYERIKLEGKFEVIFPGFRQVIREERIRQIRASRDAGRAIPSNTPIYVSTPDETTSRLLISIPVVGRAAAGLPIEMIEQQEDNLFADGIHQGDFAVIAVGDSMIGADINDGDKVVIRPQPTVDNGDIALVAVDEGSTLKRVYFSPDSITLMPANPAYKAQNYAANTDIRILGKYIKVIKDRNEASSAQ